TSDMAGVSAGPHEDKMGLRASSTTTVHFDNVRVPAANVLGEEGKGFKVAMKILNSGRTGLGGGAVGAMKNLIGHATKQVKERVQFGKSISEFPLIREKIAGMVVDCYASEAAVSLVAALIDQGYEDYAVEAAISKVFASEALWRVSDEALQAAGGNGFMCDFPYERVVRDARINRIFEGTNEILRLFIALTAMNDVGAQLKELAASLRGAFNDPIKGFGVLSDYALKRAALVTGIQRGKSAFTKLNPALKEHGELFESLTRDLASEVDKTLRRYGREIIGKQLPTKRLADVMIDLFVFACVISRVNTSLEKNGKSAAKEQEILTIFASQVRKRVKANIAALEDNTDKVLDSVAEHTLNLEGYGWDTV
ncbi:MAG: acyl-CoA dehydrogenase family protein, partial [Myxococcaceae bacterium]